MVNADYSLANRLILLKRHLNSCKQCHDARKAKSPHDMCGDGITQVLLCADKYDALIKLRLQMRDPNVQAFIPCPNTAAHGASYALMATPLLIAGELKALF
jgi:hypothetical protein